MRIEDSSSNEITNLTDRAKLYETPQTLHQWKEGRSAYSVADFIVNHDGVRIIQNRIEEVIGQTLQIERAVPEYEVRFDNFGRGRIHDIALFGTTTKGETIFVGVEAKVDETKYATKYAAQRNALGPIEEDITKAVNGDILPTLDNGRVFESACC